MRKAASKKVLEEEKTFWHGLKKAAISKGSKFCQK
jgi:hypothetical protein